MSQEWKERTRPVRLEKRYEFPNYDLLRDFLDLAADLSEKVDFYPDMGFGKDYVNVTIHLDDGADTISEAQHDFAKNLDLLADQTAS